jgi:hypothetical protein
MRSPRVHATKWRPHLVKSDQLKDLLHAARLPRRDALALILASRDGQPVTTTEIQKIGKDSGLRDITTWNVTQYLNTNEGLFVRLPAGWTLGPKGKQDVVALVSKINGGQPAVINQSLRLLIPKLPNEESKAFVGEAISCYEAKCYRAAVVLSWVGAVAVLHNRIIVSHLVAFNAEASARDPDWKTAKVADDLGLMKEDRFLDILVKISVLGKNVKELLKNQCLALRNACGHPNSVQPGENMVAAHLEILANHVFSKF